VPRGTPSRRNWTPAIPIELEAVAWRVTRLETVSRERGAVSVMVGGGTGGGGGAVTVRTKVAEPVPPEFEAPRFTLVVPAAVGVPEISPVMVLIESPVGRGLALKLVGLFVAVIW
jgi:hypothetical protein